MRKVKFNFKNAALNLMFFVFAATVIISFNACNKNDDPIDYEPGSIPGLGEAEGDLTGTSFRLPDGIELTEDITGNADQDNYWDLYSSSGPARSFINKNGAIESKSFAFRAQHDENEPTICYSGSGYGYVDLLLKLRNIRSTPVTVTFPAATILISKAGNCQNGVLIKKVTVTVPANSSYNICLSFYCGNLHKSSAHRNDIYVLGVVSNAQPLLDLCERVKNKKINIEEFLRTSRSDYNIYSGQVDRLQSIVWHVTDGEGLTQYDIEYINSLLNS